MKYIKFLWKEKEKSLIEIQIAFPENRNANLERKARGNGAHSERELIRERVISNFSNRDVSVESETDKDFILGVRHETIIHPRTHASYLCAPAVCILSMCN